MLIEAHDDGGTGAALSLGQEALWFLWKLVPDSHSYNIVLPVAVRGVLDVDAFQDCLERLCRRHAGLRTRFSDASGQPLQFPCSDVDSSCLTHVDASTCSDLELNEAIRRFAREPFDLEANASLRAMLFRINSNHHVLVIVVHHIISDLWSLIVFMDELRELYASRRENRKCDLPPLPVQYEDYVRWQRRMLDGAAGERLWSYWDEQLRGELPTLDLPTDHSRPAMQSFRGGTTIHRIDAELSNRLQQLAGQESSTPFMALLAVYAVLLHRYTGQPTVMIGTPTAGRPRDELSGLVGDFVNMVPLRVDLSSQPSFRQLLEQVRVQVVGAIKHSDYPFSMMVDRLHPTRDLSRSPIFQTTFVLQKFHRFEELSSVMLPDVDEPTVPFADLALEPIPFAQQDGQFDLNLEMKIDSRGQLVAAWKYAADLFEENSISRMAGHFETLMREVVSNPERPVNEFPLLTKEEREHAIQSGSALEIGLPPATTVCELFEAQALASPDRIAVSCEADELTYSQLLDRVDRAARVLVELGAGRDVLVAILLPRGLDFITAMLAVSKAGGAFLPLDPRHPPSRLVKILENSRTPLVLTSADKLDIGAGVDPSRLQPQFIDFQRLKGQQSTAELPKINGEDLAYVMFTSGSTGDPKGVMVEHRGMINHCLAKLTDLEMSEDAVLAQNGPQSFDIVVWQCVAPLIRGGRIVVFPDHVAENPSLLISEVERRGVTVLQLVPSMLTALLQEAELHTASGLESLRWMVPTGEALPTDLCCRWFKLFPTIPVLNTYGSTECSDDQCHYVLRELSPADSSVPIVSIGTPIRNMTAHVLDDKLAPVPSGVVGELYIGGLGVGRGYCHDPDRTRTAFIPDPFSSHANTRLYRTRDLARRRSDGNLDFLGRVDHMIKLHGFRIEPGEIEAALTSHPNIASAAVVARQHPFQGRKLVGYVVVKDNAVSEILSEDIREYLSGRLPQYMIPSVICLLKQLPITGNGKLDQKRLPEPEWHTVPAEEIVAPRTETEQLLARIWSETLGIPQVGVTQDFFSIGGDSILSIQIISRCKRAGMELRPSDLFQHPTIADLALHAERVAGMNGESPTNGFSAQLPAGILPEHLSLAFDQVQFDD